MREYVWSGSLEWSPWAVDLPLAVVGDVISWPIAITGAAVMTLVVALWLGIWSPVLRKFEA